MMEIMEYIETEGFTLKGLMYTNDEEPPKIVKKEKPMVVAKKEKPVVLRDGEFTKRMTGKGLLNPSRLKFEGMYIGCDVSIEKDKTYVVKYVADEDGRFRIVDAKEA